MSLQLYPFGYPHGDTALPYQSSGQGSSSAITLTKSVYFYDEIMRTAFVSYSIMRMYIIIRIRTDNWIKI